MDIDPNHLPEDPAPAAADGDGARWKRRRPGTAAAATAALDRAIAAGALWAAAGAGEREPAFSVCGRPGQCRSRGSRRARNLGGARRSSSREGKTEGPWPGGAAEIFAAATGGPRSGWGLPAVSAVPERFEADRRRGQRTAGVCARLAGGDRGSVSEIRLPQGMHRDNGGEAHGADRERVGGAGVAGAGGGEQVWGSLCATNTPTAMEVWSCVRDEGRPLGACDQEPAPNHRELLSLRAMVVSVAETTGLDPVR